mgnify:CR=1 FL=1
MGLFIEGDFQVPINHSHYDQMYQSGCAISVDVQVSGSDIYMSEIMMYRVP